MRYIVTVAALILSYGTSYAQSSFVYDPGGQSCEKYLHCASLNAIGGG